MTAYEDFYPWVLPEVAGCPEITATQAIRDTVIEFCERSLIHQADHDPVSTVAQNSDYDLVSPVKGTRVVKVMRAWHKNTELLPAAPDQVRDPHVYSRSIGGTETSYATPTHFVQKDSETFSLLPIPDQSIANVITMRVALAPLRNSASCEDFLFDHWADVIGAGALARLQLSAGKAYTNVQAANVNQARFIQGINNARMKANRGYARANLSVQMRKI